MQAQTHAHIHKHTHKYTHSQAKIDESIHTLKLEVEMAVRQVKGAVNDKEKALVDHDVMKLVSFIFAAGFVIDITLLFYVMVIIAQHFGTA